MNVFGRITFLVTVIALHRKVREMVNKIFNSFIANCVLLKKVINRFSPATIAPVSSTLCHRRIPVQVEANS